MGKSTISMAIFNGYVNLPKGKTVSPLGPPVGGSHPKFSFKFSGATSTRRPASHQLHNCEKNDKRPAQFRPFFLHLVAVLACSNQIPK